MGMKFTPGPWEVVWAKGVQIYAPCAKKIASVKLNVFDPTKSHSISNSDTLTRRANANLIAAAPEMYDVIDRLVPWLENDPNADSDEYCSFAKEMRRVLKKARGES